MSGREAQEAGDGGAARSVGASRSRQSAARTPSTTKSASDPRAAKAKAPVRRRVAVANTAKNADDAATPSLTPPVTRVTPAVRRKAVHRSAQPESVSSPPVTEQDNDAALDESELAGESLSTPALTHSNSNEPEDHVYDPNRHTSDGMHTMDGKPAEPKPRPVSRNLDPSQLYRGRARMALIRDLAMGEWTSRSIADSVGVPVEIIEDFKETYEHEISEVRAALAGQLAIESAGLWISKRQNRISELQSDFEDIDLVIEVMRKNTKQKLEEEAILSGSDSMVKGDVFDTDLLLGSRRHQNLLRAKIAVLRAVADEYAPNKQKKDAEQEDKSIRYVIEQDTGDDILESLT
jgi:hypothetical protein